MSPGEVAASFVDCQRCSRLLATDAFFCASCGYVPGGAPPRLAPGSQLSRPVPFVDRMLDLRTLRPAVRLLTRIALLLVVLSCALLTFVAVPFGSIDLIDSPQLSVDIAWPFGLTVLVLFVTGWAYIVVGMLAAPSPVRWTLLGLFSVAVWLVTLIGAGLTRPDTPPLTLVVLAPVTVALAIVWSVAAYRVVTRVAETTIPQVLAVLAGFALLFGLLQIASTVLAEASGDPSTYSNIFTVLVAGTYFSFTFFVLYPLYTFFGLDLGHVILGGARTALHWAQRVAGQRFDAWAALVVGLAAIGLEVILRRDGFGDAALFWIGVVALWTTALAGATWLFLRAMRARSMEMGEPDFGAAFWIVVLVWCLFALLSIVGAPNEVFLAHTAVGALCLLAAAAGLRFRRWSGRVASFVGLVGIWALFLDAPQSAYGVARPWSDPFGATDPLFLSGIGLVVLSVAAQRNPRLAPLRTAGTLWTGALWLIRAVIALSQRGEAQLDLLSSLQFLLLVLLFALAATAIPWQYRALGAIVVVITLGVSIVFALRGGAPALTTAILLAVGTSWHVLMSGSRITNRDSALWPRDSRVLLYLGYTLLGLAVAFFYLTVHGLRGADPPLVVFPLTGLRLLGPPATLYVLWVGLYRSGLATADSADPAARA